MEVVRVVAHEQVHRRVGEQIVNALESREETVGVGKLSPHERVQQRTVEAPMPQTLKETVEVTVDPHERVQQRQCLPESPMWR